MRLGAVFLLSVLPISMSSALLTKEECFRMCKRFAQITGVDFPKSEIRVDRKDTGLHRSWRVTVGEQMYQIDDHLKYVSAFVDLAKLPSRSPNGLTAKEVEIKAISLMKLLGATPGMKLWRTSPAKNTPGFAAKRGKLYLFFAENPRGLNPSGLGNNVSVCVDRGSQRLVSYVEGRGWRYQTPSIRVSVKEASKIALKHLRSLGERTTGRISSSTAYWQPSAIETSTDHQNLYRNRQLRVCRWISIGRSTVTVDAETGKIHDVSTVAIPLDRKRGPGGFN